MPSIREAVGADLSGYVPMMSEPAVKSTAPVTQSTVRASTVLRCPLPPFGADVDSLRQFEQGAGVPQIRIIPPPLIVSTISTAAAGGQLAGGSSSSASSGSTTVSLVAASTTVNVGTLTPLAAFTGTASLLKKSFQLLSVSSTAPCEVRLYGTALAQLVDASRVTDDPVPAEVSQNFMTDIVFDTIPYVWGWQNRIAANQDTPQTGTIYVTVINPDASNTISGLAVVLTYLPLES